MDIMSHHNTCRYKANQAIRRRKRWARRRRIIRLPSEKAIRRLHDQLAEALR